MSNLSDCALVFVAHLLVYILHKYMYRSFCIVEDNEQERGNNSNSMYSWAHNVFVLYAHIIRYLSGPMKPLWAWCSPVPQTGVGVLLKGSKSWHLTKTFTSSLEQLDDLRIMQTSGTRWLMPRFIRPSDAAKYPGCPVYRSPQMPVSIQPYGLCAAGS